MRIGDIHEIVEAEYWAFCIQRNDETKWRNEITKPNDEIADR